MTQESIIEIITDLSNLQDLSENPEINESEIFKAIGALDKRHSSKEYYYENIDGLICNIGISLKSTKLLNYAMSRLNDKISSSHNNKFLYDQSNCIFYLAEIECQYPYSIPDLIKTKRFNEARKQFLLVKQDKYNHYEKALTNSANILEKYGRNFEAIILYDQVLKSNPKFGMALGKKALAIHYYICLAPQKSLRLMFEEVNLLKTSLMDYSIDEIGGKFVRAHFSKQLKYMEEYLSDQNEPNIFKNKFDKKITEYNKFCLENNIFLNYDFGYYYDEHSLYDDFYPSFIEGVHEERYEKNGIMSERIYFAFQVFNQIIESYTTSRLLYFEALTKKHNDKKVSYTYTFDYTKHGNKYGLLKSIFCNLYNCLDKIAHLIAFYYVADKSTLPKDIYFDWLQSIEYEDIVIKEDSFQLLALRNLSLDFQSGYRYEFLKKIRNRITHSFLNVNIGIEYSDKFKEYEITEDELIESVYQMFIIVKACLMYFTIAVRLKKTNEIIFSNNITLQKYIYY